MGIKGSWRRPRQVSRAEYDLRCAICYGELKISDEEFGQRLKKIREKMPIRSNSLGDAEFYQAKQEIKNRFHKVLTDLQKTVERNGYAVQAVQRFRGCLENPENNDVSRLPVYAPLPYSLKRNKIRCILSIISYTIQRYWDFYNGNREMYGLVNNKLIDLKNIAKKELKAFKIMQCVVPGEYYLKEIK